MADEYRLHSIGVEVFSQVPTAEAHLHAVSVEAFSQIPESEAQIHSLSVTVWRSIANATPSDPGSVSILW